MKRLHYRDATWIENYRTDLWNQVFIDLDCAYNPGFTGEEAGKVAQAVSDAFTEAVGPFLTWIEE